MDIVPHTISPEIQQIKQRFAIIGNAPALLNAIGRAHTVAPYDQSVLITGESGVGKESFPKIIHNNSPRKHNKYIAVNCGAIPEGTIDSELFGHEKGSFTGAISARKGYFEEADGGTIFLDEVGELPLTTQARLLRVLENGEFIKVGSSEVQKTNIRVVAATNVNMLKAVSEGKFREDLYYRLSTVSITIPPLRDRGSDVLLLARKFAADFAERYRTPEIEFGDDARSALLHYRWPGNVRQLKNVVEQIALFYAGEVITADIVAKHLPNEVSEGSSMAVVGGNSSTFDYSREREILFKMIFRMQKQLDDLQETVDTLKQNGAMPGTIVGHHVGGVLPDIDSESPISAQSLVRISNIDTPHTVTPVEYDEVESDIKEVPVATYDVEVKQPAMHTMTLEDTERETIRQALQRNSGNRRCAASELKISERTLYRKIKEYGLE